MVILTFTVGFLTACSVFDKPTEAREVKSDTNSRSVGRFQLLQTERMLATGVRTSTVLRIDSITGETWILDQSEAAKWVSVPDSLTTVGKYNSATGKIEWVTKTPDGRDLKDLSKEQLIRLLTGSRSSNQPSDPKEPLSIRRK